MKVPTEQFYLLNFWWVLTEILEFVLQKLKILFLIFYRKAFHSFHSFLFCFNFSLIFFCSTANKGITNSLPKARQGPVLRPENVTEGQVNIRTSTEFRPGSETEVDDEVRSPAASASKRERSRTTQGEYVPRCTKSVLKLSTFSVFMNMNDILCT